MRIVINEHQMDLLQSMLIEAALPEFSLQKLSQITSFAKRLAYCKQYLGPTIGAGTSRVVFQIDDNKVLKLAKNSKGIAQNEYEYEHYYPANQDVLPQCYEADENYTWIVSEYVLPAQEKDFEVVFHMPWEKFKGWIDRTYMQYAPFYVQSHIRPSMSKEEWLDSIENNDDIESFYYYMTNHGYEMIGDLKRIQNWGLAKRDYGPQLVLLDNGLSKEIFHQHYAKFKL